MAKVKTIRSFTESCLITRFDNNVRVNRKKLTSTVTKTTDAVQPHTLQIEDRIEPFRYFEGNLDQTEQVTG